MRNLNCLHIVIWVVALVNDSSLVTFLHRETRLFNNFVSRVDYAFLYVAPSISKPVLPRRSHRNALWTADAVHLYSSNVDNSVDRNSDYVENKMYRCAIKFPSFPLVYTFIVHYENLSKSSDIRGSICMRQPALFSSFILTVYAILKSFA